MHVKECTDHLGNKFSTVREMCDFYDIGESTYRWRLKKGWSLEQTLTSKSQKTHPTDYNGVRFASEQEMCLFYGVNQSVYRWRIKHGWSQEAALNTGDSSNICPCKDHLGNEFLSKTAMAEHYGISNKRLDARLKTGYSLEKALTEPLLDYSLTDFHGNTHASIEAMCKAYGISSSMYKDRIYRGWSQEDALTKADCGISTYEYLVMQYFKDKDMSYVFQFVDHSCVSSGGNPSRFDFSIPDVGLIEVDGEGHFRPISNWNFEKAIKDDTLKTKFCEDNDIPLLRIHYKQMQDGTYVGLIEDFLANPAKYIKQHNSLSEAEYYAERDTNICSQ